MKAVLVEQPGGVEALYLGQAPMPVPAANELLVRVAATALNRADLLQREGKYPPPPGTSDILGMEMAGVVEQVGVDCDGWSEGDRVFGLLPGGGYAEYVVLPHPMAMRIPEEMSFEDAAAIPEVFLTASQALFWLGRLESNQQVLIHAGASGVGTAAIQLARHVGARVFVTASAPKHQRCLNLGATLAIDYTSEDFADRIQEATSGYGVDLIIDFIGAPYFKQNLRSLALDGKVVLLAMMGGSRLEDVNLGLLFRKRAQVLASTLRNRPESYKIALTQAFTDRFLPSLADGTIVPVVDTVFDWTDVQEAHRYMEANKNVGKIVLRVTG